MERNLLTAGLLCDVTHGPSSDDIWCFTIRFAHVTLVFRVNVFFSGSETAGEIVRSFPYRHSLYTSNQILQTVCMLCMLCLWMKCVMDETHFTVKMFDKRTWNRSQSDIYSFVELISLALKMLCSCVDVICTSQNKDKDEERKNSKVARFHFFLSALHFIWLFFLSLFILSLFLSFYLFIYFL